MKNVFGNAITLTMFGESHGECIGGVLDGLPAGLRVDMDRILKEMAKRRSLSSISTPRKEADIPVFLSGVRGGYTEGTSVAFTIANRNAHSSDYDSLRSVARPGHADYSAHMKYGGYQDARGGGHFSGRLTAVLVAAGAILMPALESKGILIGSHIKELGGIPDAEFSMEGLPEELTRLNDLDFAVIDTCAGEKMIECIRAVRADNDSVGGILETVVLGLEAGLGEPAFGSVESELARAMFSIGAVKGIEFGSGFELARMRGSEANDPFRVEDGKVITLTNHNGGVNGGITNGMPVVFRTVIKPTPSIGKVQKTIDFGKMENTEICIQGRHDPAIVHRARAAVDAMTAFVIADLICQRHGYKALI